MITVINALINPESTTLTISLTYYVPVPRGSLAVIHSCKDCLNHVLLHCMRHLTQLGVSYIQDEAPEEATWG